MINHGIATEDGSPFVLRLHALAEQAEAAIGPDRGIDRAIYHDVLGYCRHARTERSGAQSDTGFDCLDCGADSWGNKSKPPYPPGQKLHDAAPAYTASIDAAMALLDQYGVLMQLSDIGADGLPLARVGRPDLDGESIFTGISSGVSMQATPLSGLSLALCAAALRARAATENGER
jgi:hypothetical protein